MNDIYKTLKKRGLTTSQRDFSTRYAGKSPSYLATMNSPSDGALVAVFPQAARRTPLAAALRVAHMVFFRPNRQAPA